ncbi:MAG: ribbon-helix-helix protein, CopG family [Pseudomonadota bacterium]
MKGITIKLPDETMRRLSAEARASGRSIAAVVRDKLAASEGGGDTVDDRASDLAGILAGSRRAATNERRRFRRT